MNELLKILQKIPKGQVTTYKALGEKFHLHPRQIGRILHKNNELEKYPCYKVVRSDGSVAKGYAGSGRSEQIRRLKADGVHFIKNKVDLHQSLYILK